MRFVLLILILSMPPPGTAATDLVFGRFSISVSDSWTAQVFHIVDQMSEWDQYAHKAYVRWARTNLSLDAQDRELLQKHAALRRARGWGNGFEQAFLVEDSIQGAAARAVAQKLLTPDEALSEQAILQHFAPKLEKLRDAHHQQLAAFQAQLLAERQRLLPWFDKLLRFTQTESALKAPVFLVVNAEETSGGGEANGGRIVVEVPAPDPLGTLFHESLHVLLRPHLNQIQAAAEAAGWSAQNLHEGIVYALAPGLTDNPAQDDRLAEQIARYFSRGTPASDNYAQAYLMASVIRPVLRASIDAGETFEVFLPKAVDRWRRFVPK